MLLDNIAEKQNGVENNCKTIKINLKSFIKLISTIDDYIWIYSRPET